MNRSLKIWIMIIVLAMAMSVSAVKAEPISSTASIAIGSWLLNFFSAQPQRWQTSNGTFEVRIEVPAQYRDQLARVRYLYPINRENALPGQQGQVLRLIANWPTQVSAFFPTGEKEVRKSYWRVDNGAAKGEFKEPPYRFDLPYLDDVTNAHFIEMGVGTGRNSGGSVSAMYRCNTPEGYYAEMLANQQFAALGRDEFVKKAQPAKLVVVESIPLSPIAQPLTQYGSAKIILLDMRNYPIDGKVAINVTYPSGKIFSGTYQTLVSKPLVVNNLDPGSILKIRPVDGVSWFSRQISVGETVIQLKRRGN